MKIFNTLTHKEEEFISNTPEKVYMYTCGPTVYHYAHIGNLRTYIQEDILEKTLKYLGYYVIRAMNITDVGHLTSDSDSGDDKMLKGAKRENKTVEEIAKFYTDAFLEDAKKLNITIPEILVPATSNIDFYIEIIQDLLDKGFAYKSGDNIYFDVSKVDDYYKLTNHKVDDMIVGVREGVDHDDNKHNQEDFVLWFTKSKFENHEMKWNSPFGEGYPGWHIECTGIAIKYLGEYLDIHCGAVDNIFPHHTNEIAQSESYLGHKWCNYWFHPQHLNLKEGKMSKSSGDFITLNTLIEKGYNPLSFRFMCLNSHYRKTLDFSYEALDKSEKDYIKLIKRIMLITEDGEFQELAYNDYTQRFADTLSNDLNTANSLTVLYDLLKDDSLTDKTKTELIRNFDKVLGLNLVNINQNKIHPQHEEIMELIEKRNKYKEDHRFEEADGIRGELLSRGIELIDTKEGTIYKIKNY